jgi:hypothetical protein
MKKAVVTGGFDDLRARDFRFLEEAAKLGSLTDAEPEIARIKPNIYAVNEDGDQPEKRAFCEEHGLEYVVLKRLPKVGLPRRESTVLRGF